MKTHIHKLPILQCPHVALLTVSHKYIRNQDTPAYYFLKGPRVGGVLRATARWEEGVGRHWDRSPVQYLRGGQRLPTQSNIYDADCV